MSATTVRELSEQKLLKLVLNPLQRDEALAEIDRRKQVSIDLNAMAVTSAMSVITSFFGEGVTTRQIAEAYVSIKAPKWYGEIALAQPLADLKSALYTVLKSEGVSLEATALKEWFANN